MKTIIHSGERCRVVDDTPAGLFKVLDAEGVAAFRAWADDQPEGTVIEPIWHPVAQDQLFITSKGVEAQADGPR